MVKIVNTKRHFTLVFDILFDDHFDKVKWVDVDFQETLLCLSSLLKCLQS